MPTKSNRIVALPSPLSLLPSPHLHQKKVNRILQVTGKKEEDVLMDLVGELILFRPMFHYIGFSSILPSAGFFGGEKTTEKKKHKKKKGKNK